MKLEGYGVTLELLTQETAEIVRQWRNSAEILQQMEYQEKIGPEAQQLWFESVQNESCKYFTIAYYGELVGMIHLAQIDLSEKTAEAGLFIGNTSFSGTGIALGASLLLLAFAFETLSLENIFAKVKNTNFNARQYNQLLGFQKAKELNADFALYVLPKDTYLQQKPKLEKLANYPG